jgi:uncharacterized membrane-anchored protein
MKKLLAFILAFFPLFGLTQDNELLSLPWQRGPVIGTIGDKATINVPPGYMFLDAESTKIFDRMNGNPPVEGLYTIMPESGGWFGQFYFEDTGYIKDNEKIDPDDLLSSLKNGDKQGTRSV